MLVRVHKFTSYVYVVNGMPPYRDLIRDNQIGILNRKRRNHISSHVDGYIRSQSQSFCLINNSYEGFLPEVYLIGDRNHKCFLKSVLLVGHPDYSSICALGSIKVEIHKCAGLYHYPSQSRYWEAQSSIHLSRCRVFVEV